MTSNIQKPKLYLQKKAPTQSCPNCNAKFSGNYCSNCGQSIANTNKPFKDFLSDMLGTLYAFDIRFWYSIKTMFTNPAKLSEDFLLGKRSSYTPPFKLYFFVSCLFFFTINWLTSDSLSGNSNFLSTDDSGVVTLNFENDSIVNENDSIENVAVPVDSLIKEIWHEPDTVAVNDNSNKMFDFSEGRLEGILKNKGDRKYFMSRVFKFLSWMLIILMPLFALILKGLYARQKQYYIRHLIFAVNTHTQTFFILILFFVLNHYLDDFKYQPQDFLLFVFPAYLIYGMKKYYKQSWRKTIAKFFILTSLYNFVLLAAVVLVFIIAFGTY